MAHVRGRPAAADHVLVEVLPRTQPEHEAAVPGEQRDRRRLLGDDGRVVPHGRAGHVGHERHALGRRRDRPEHGPRVGRVALRVEPGEVVVADDLEVEPRLLGGDGVGDELAGPALLAHQGVTEGDHARVLSVDRGMARLYPMCGRSDVPIVRRTAAGSPAAWQSNTSTTSCGTSSTAW